MEKDFIGEHEISPLARFFPQVVSQGLRKF